MIEEWIREHSTLVFGGVAALIIGLAFLRRNTTTSTTTAPAGDYSGLATSGGQPVVYRDTGDTFINVTVPSQTSPAPSNPIMHPIESVTRPRFYPGGNPGNYDQTHTGIPIRSSAGAGNNVLRLAPYGTELDLASASPIAGASNFLNSPNGSTEWYAVAGGGYVSSYDLSQIS